MKFRTTQHTLSQEVSVKGIGLHSGKEAEIVFRPADPGHGVKFRRVDLKDQPVIPADVSRVFSTRRGTTLASNDVMVNTVEHALSALVGLQIDNVLIDIDGPEVPILDGSALPFVIALKKAGSVDQGAEREIFKITEKLTYTDPENGVEIIAYPSDEFELTVMIDFESHVLGQQYAMLSDFEDYETQIAPCRTFVFVRELEYLLEQDLIKGGDLNNSIVIADTMMSQDELDRLAAKLGKPSVKVDRAGIVNTLDLHFKK